MEHVHVNLESQKSVTEHTLELFVRELNGTAWTGAVMTLNRMSQEGRESIYVRMDVRFSRLHSVP